MIEIDAPLRSCEQQEAAPLPPDEIRRRLLINADIEAAELDYLIAIARRGGG